MAEVPISIRAASVRAVLASWALVLAHWLLVWLWLVQGLQGAGNVVMALWAMLSLSACMVLIATSQPLQSAIRPEPRWRSVLWSLSHLFFCLLMAWMGFWWMFAAGMWVALAVASARAAVRKAIAAADAAAARDLGASHG